MKVGICAIIKDCNPEYLIEWIDWHKLIDFDYFFIYDNGSRVPIKSIINDPCVIVYDLPGIRMQMPAYELCIYMQRWRCQPQCDWIAFIDDDEFIVVESGSIKQLLLEQNGAGLALNWIVFAGTGKCKIEGAQIDKYTRHVPVEHLVNRHVKSIVRPISVEGLVNPHYFYYRNGKCYSVTGEKIRGPFVKTPVMKKAWINHYWNRSEEEYIAKLCRGRIDPDYVYCMAQYQDVENNAICTSTRISEIRNKLLDL